MFIFLICLSNSIYYKKYLKYSLVLTRIPTGSYLYLSAIGNEGPRDSRQLSFARDEGLSQFSYPLSRAYKCKILKFGFSYCIMSPSVGLTFPVLYTFCLLNNIMAEFQWKVWKHKLFYGKCLWISDFFKFLPSLVLQ